MQTFSVGISVWRSSSPYFRAIFITHFTSFMPLVWVRSCARSWYVCTTHTHTHTFASTQKVSLLLKCNVYIKLFATVSRCHYERYNHWTSTCICTKKCRFRYTAKMDVSKLPFDIAFWRLGMHVVRSFSFTLSFSCSFSVFVLSIAPSFKQNCNAKKNFVPIVRTPDQLYIHTVVFNWTHEIKTMDN